MYEFISPMFSCLRMKYLLLSLAVFLVTKSIITTIIVDKTVSGTFNIAIAPKVVITENRLLRTQ